MPPEETINQAISELLALRDECSKDSTSVDNRDVVDLTSKILLRVLQKQLAVQEFCQ